MQTTSPNSLEEARRVARISGRFRDLQGLRQAVGGVGLLLFFGWELRFPLSDAEIRAAGMGFTLLGLGLLAAGCAFFALAVLRVNSWYRRHYGQVEQTVRQKRWGAIVGGAGLLAFLIPFYVGAIGHVPSVNLTLVALSLWTIGYWLYMGRRFWHYGLIACLGFACGIASIAGIPPATFAWHSREATLYLALVSIAGGVIDHMILTRALPGTESPVALEP
jgi:hypothetical protein